VEVVVPVRRLSASGFSALAVSGTLLLGTLLLGTLLLGACPQVPDLDQDPPRIVSVEPEGPIVPTQTAFVITFSEPLNPATVIRDDDGETVVLAEREQVTDAFITDISSPPLIDSRKDDIVPAEVELSADNTQVVLTPLVPLLPGTAYTLLVSRDVRDASGNPIFGGVSGARETFRFDVVTDDGPPNLIADDLSADGLVAPNRKRFTVYFDQPVIGLGKDTFTVEAFDSAAQATVESVFISEDRDAATLVLADGVTCERLTPGADYALRVGPGIRDAEGETMETVTLPFTTSTSCDVAPHVVFSSQAIASEVTATIRFETSKPSTTQVRFGLQGRELDCLGTTPCPVFGADANDPLPGASPRFAHDVVLTGLSIDQTYSYRAVAEDFTGQSAMVEGSFTTSTLPEVAVNEIMANPSADQAGDSEADGEYIELFNYGDVSVDLSGWALEVDGGDEGEGKTCTFPDDGTAPFLSAGGYVVIAGSGFDPGAWGLVSGDVWLQATSRACDTLSNSRAQPIVLVDADGRPISSFAGFAALLPTEDGRSIERITPDAPDVVDSFCYSNPQAGPTPGAENAVAAGCAE